MNWACPATPSATPRCSHDALERRQIAVLAYHPHLSDAADAALARFVNSGGKLLACYLVPPRLAAALGFSDAQYVRQQRPGQFAEIRFEAAGVAGLPAAVRQDSWNIMVLRPAGFHARVVGRWYDDAGHADRPGGPVAERSRRVASATSSCPTIAKARSRCSPRCWVIYRRRFGGGWPRRNWIGPGGPAIAATSRRRLRLSTAGGDRGGRGRSLTPPRRRWPAARRDFAAGPLRRGRRRGAAAATTNWSEAYLRAQPTPHAAKPAPCGTIRARGPIRATGTARPASWPATVST